MNRVTPADQRPQALRAVAARQAIAERFLAAANTPPSAANETLAFPAFLSLKSIRIQHDGSLNISINIPAEHVNDTFLRLTGYCGHPVVVSMDVIEIDHIDALEL